MIKVAFWDIFFVSLVLLGIAGKSLNYNFFHQIDYLMLLGMPLQTTNMKVSFWMILKLNIDTVHPELFSSGSEEGRMRLGWHCLLQPRSELLKFA